MENVESGYKVGDAMTMNVVAVQEATSLHACAKVMHQSRIGSLIVLSELGKPVGILTERDLVRKSMAHDVKPSEMLARDIMVPNLITVSPSEDILEALRLMRDHDIRHLPVVHEERLVGFVTAKDLLSIQPDLFELWAEHYTIREADRKPIRFKKQ